MTSDAAIQNGESTVGACQFIYQLGPVKRFLSMSLVYSDEALFTPNEVEASALYYMIKKAIIEGEPEAKLLELESTAQDFGAGFTRLRPIYKSGKLTSIWISIGALSVFGTPERLTQIHNDMRDAVDRGVGDPDYYLDRVVRTFEDR